MRTSVSFLALLAIAACSSSNSTGAGVASDVAGTVDNVPALRALIEADASGSDATTDFAAALADFETSATEVGLADIRNSRFDALPTTGTADYAGFVQVDAGPTANVTAELGLTADFAENGQITGDITSPFFGAGPDGLVEFQDDVEVVFGATRARGVGNGARVDIAGTISNETDTIAVDAIIEGRFIGTPIVGAKGTVNVGDAFGTGANAVNALDLTLNDITVPDGSVSFTVLAE